MSNYIEYNDKIAFHPGYYIKEIIDESGLTQADFAKRLGTTAKNISKLVNGEQSLSTDIALKLSRMLGTSVNYWLNLQSAYDSLAAEFTSEEELKKERKIFKNLDYKYFRDNFGLPDFPRMIDRQIKALREFLRVSSLELLEGNDLAVNFRSSTDGLSSIAMIKANVMVQIATNMALDQHEDMPNYNKKRFDKAVEYVLTLTTSHGDFYHDIQNAFFEAGVSFVILPNLTGSHVNGATKKLDNTIMLMVNDRNHYSDTFWFTLFHEIGHIENGDYGISVEDEIGDRERKADEYARDRLIPSEEYDRFIKTGNYSRKSIIDFARKIERDPGIVVGRLAKDEKISYTDASVHSLRRKFIISDGYSVNDTIG